MTETLSTLIAEPKRVNGSEAPDRLPRPPDEAPSATAPLRVPEKGMIGLARDFADLYSEYLESPKAFFYFSFLTELGAIISKKVTLASALRVQPRLYTVLLGESADTRKSTALSQVDEFFKELFPVLPPRPWRTLHGVGSAEGLAEVIGESGNKPFLLHYDELRSFVQKGKVDSSVLLPMVNTLFERGDYDDVTKKTRDGAGGLVSVRNASLSLLAASTKETYSTMFTEAFTAIGFTNRLWLVVDRTEKSFSVPGKIPADKLDALRVTTRGLLEKVDKAYQANGEKPVEYRMTPEAQQMFTDWYESRTGSIFERRLDTYGHRLALLLAVTSGKSEIDEEVMTAVIELLRYQLEARRESDPVDAETKIAALEERVRRALVRGPLKEWELKKRVNATRSGLWAWEVAVSNLRKAGEIVVGAGKVYRLASPDASRPS